MMTQAWDDAYHQLWKQAAQYRGLREATGEIPSHVLSQTLRQWPRTRGADVVAIAAVLDPVLSAAPLESGGYGIERKWRRCTSDLADVALRDPAREYHHNRTFWSTLASAAAYLASADVPVPEAMWPALLAEVASAESPHPSAAGDEQLHLTAYSHDELWQAQKTALAKLRGADVRAPPPEVIGGRIAIPRTTNADVLQLATYWTHVLAEAELKRREMTPSSPHALHTGGLDGELRRWRAVLADVDTYATARDPAAIYPKNEEFWRASASVSATIAVIDEAPPPFGMRLDTLVQQPNTERRNATYPGEGSFETMWDKQHNDFVDTRGFDTREALPGRAGRPMKIPRTLNSEVTKLAGYWNTAWKKLEDRRGVFGNLPTEIGLDSLKKRWQEVMKDVGAIAAPGKGEEVYPKNHEFWRETFELAQTLDLFNELPTKFDIAIDVVRDVPDRIAHAVGDVARAVGNVAHEAGKGLLSSLGTPLLIGGGAVLGLVLLLRRSARREAT
ncbi:MAG TPA: hypothetical protein VF469_04610 [Kofleriaceae bacterium]